MKYSPKQFYLDFPKSKRKNDTIFCRFFLRPLSFVFSSFFTLLGIGANAVSIISLFFSIYSCGFLVAFYFSNLNVFFYLSIASFFVWAILDCVDGNIARSIKKEKYGDFLDAVAGYIYPGIYFSILGLCSCKTENITFLEFNNLILLLSILAGTSIITLILANKKFEENSLSYLEQSESVNKEQKNTIFNIAKRLWSEFSFGGFMPLIILLGFIFKVLNLVVLIYSICFLLLFCFGLMYLLLKTIKANRR